MRAYAHRFCAVIPCYRHAKFLSKVIAQILPHIKDCIVVDDGNSEEDSAQIKKICGSFPGAVLVSFETNRGKGAAVMAGLEKAHELGFSHAVQIDADGQHAIEELPEFIERSLQYSQECICGYPVYDASVPKARLFGRKITHFWVCVETLSLSIKDSMCGFRVYPVERTLEVINPTTIAKRMDFDIDILVRLYWAGVDMKFIPVPVRYPEDGITNFKVLKDNCRITKLHTRLFFESLLHVKSNLLRTSGRKSKYAHWSEIKERRGALGVRFLLAVYRLGGREAFRLFTAPVITLFWMTGTKQRAASREFQKKVFLYSRPADRKTPHSSLKHFLCFADSLLDKIIVWSDYSTVRQTVRFADEETKAVFSQSDSKKGRLLIVSHLGCAEMMKSIGERSFNAEIYILLFDKNANNFKRMMAQAAPRSQINLLEVDEININTAIFLKEKVDKGAWVALAGDRIPLNAKSCSDSRVIEESFLGEKALFPIGPYVLGSVLDCPVYSMFALRQNSDIVVFCHKISDRIQLPRGDRKAAIRKYSGQFVKELETMACLYPLQWFNFFDFWAQNADSQK